jgi:hypothetical protein
MHIKDPLLRFFQNSRSKSKSGLSTGLIFLFSLLSSPKAPIFVRRIRRHVFLEETTVNSPLSLNALNFTKRLPLTS